MLTKILLIIAGILILIVAVETGIYFSTKGFPAISKPTSQPSPSPSSEKPVILLATSTYLVTGTISSTFKTDEDGNLSGNFVLFGDPKKTIHKLIILVFDSKVTLIKNSTVSALIKETQLLNSADVISKVTPYHKIRMRINFITTRPLKQNEIITRQALDNLTKGNWEIPRLPAFISDNLEVLD